MSGAASVVTALALTACSNSGGGGHAADTATTASTAAKATTTTTQPATTTTTAPPPYSFDGSVPAPELINTGTDYEPVYRSLDAYYHWLLAHHPDESLVSAAYAPGTTAYNATLSDVRTLTQHDLRYYESASAIAEVVVVSTLDDAVTLRASYTDDRRATVRRDGSVAEEQTALPDSTFIVLMVRDGSGVWRIASSDRQQ